MSEIAENLRAFGEYMYSLWTKNHHHPADDSINLLIAFEKEVDPLSEAVLPSMITLLIFAGQHNQRSLKDKKVGSIVTRQLPLNGPYIITLTS